jgi:hypothetical protein
MLARVWACFMLEGERKGEREGEREGRESEKVCVCMREREM